MHDNDMQKIRRQILVVLGAGALSVPLAGFAQKPAKMRRIGYLVGPRSGHDFAFEAFRQRLRELGHVDGKTIIIEYRSAKGTHEGLPALAAELVKKNVDLIYASSTPATLAATRATRTIPIVFTGVADPVGQKIVTSLPRPGGNVTGVATQNSEVSSKSLELLKEIIPSATRIALLANPTNESHEATVSEMQAAARYLRLEAHVVYAGSVDALDKAFAETKRLRVDGMAIISDSVFNSFSKQVAGLALAQRLPAISGAPVFAEDGGLISYGWNRPEQTRRGADLVDKVLKGAKPADLPVEQPTKFDLIVNLKTAKALGLSVPATIMVRADQVIQ